MGPATVTIDCRRIGLVDWVRAVPDLPSWKPETVDA